MSTSSEDSSQLFESLADDKDDKLLNDSRERQMEATEGKEGETVVVTTIATTLPKSTISEAQATEQQLLLQSFEEIVKIASKIRSSIEEVKTISDEISRLTNESRMKTLMIEELSTSLEHLISSGVAQSAVRTSSDLSENLKASIQSAQRIIESASTTSRSSSDSSSRKRGSPSNFDPSPVLQAIKRTKDSEVSLLHSYCMVCETDDHMTQYCPNFPTGKARRQILRNRRQCVKCGIKRCDGTKTVCSNAFHLCPFCRNREPMEAGLHMPQLCDQHWESSEDPKSNRPPLNNSNALSNSSDAEKVEGPPSRTTVPVQRQNSARAPGRQSPHRKQFSYQQNVGAFQSQAPQPLMSLQPFRSVPTMMQPPIQMYPVHPMAPVNNGSMVQFAQNPNVPRDPSRQSRRQRKAHPKSDPAKRDGMPIHSWCPQE